MRPADKILTESLVKYNLLSFDEVRSVLSEAPHPQDSLRNILLEKEIISEKQMLIALSQTLNLEVLNLREISVEPDAVSKVPIKIVWYYKFMPVCIKGKTLTIVSAIPFDVKILDEIRMHIGLDIQLKLAVESDVLEAIKKSYGLASETIDQIISKNPQREKSSSLQESQWVEDLEKQSEDPTVSKLVNQIILEAYRQRATDIHIEPYRERVRFRYRIDGALVDANLPENVKHFILPILSRIKILANLSITEKRLPQDGSAVVKTKEQQLDLRISTMPTPRGESMVIRLLPSKMRLFNLEKLGFNKGNIGVFKNLIEKPHGIIFMTGPTGSGKTTTLYACLNEINSDQRKIITIEDPVEYEMEGITQIQVNKKLEFGFSTGLRSILRHDPDIIMVGEVRDLETAEIAIRTALTGHLVFSSLHTNDSASGVTRLIDMGLEPYLVASSVESFVAQRLVRIICSKCKELDPNPLAGVNEEIRESLKLGADSHVEIYRGRGCEHCNQTGYFGRVAIYEILIMNDTIRKAVLDKPRSDYIKDIAVAGGMRTLRQSAWYAVLEGSTTPSEVMNITVKDASTTKEENTTKDFFQGVMKNFQKKEKILKQSEWQKTKVYESRSYPRSFEPVEIIYRLMKRDPDNPDFLLSDGIEFSTVTKDISAAGLKFVAKNLVSVGSILEVTIKFGLGYKSVDCLAKVCRIEEDSLQNIYTMVTYYLDITSADKSLINKFVEQKTKEDNVVVSEKEV